MYLICGALQGLLGQLKNFNRINVIILDLGWLTKNIWTGKIVITSSIGKSICRSDHSVTGLMCKSPNLLGDAYAAGFCSLVPN